MHYSWTMSNQIKQFTGIRREPNDHVKHPIPMTTFHITLSMKREPHLCGNYWEVSAVGESHGRTVVSPTSYQ
jgi:hypothetical protein